MYPSMRPALTIFACLLCKLSERKSPARCSYQPGDCFKTEPDFHAALRADSNEEGREREAPEVFEQNRFTRLPKPDIPISDTYENKKQKKSRINCSSSPLFSNTLRKVCLEHNWDKRQLQLRIRQQ